MINLPKTDSVECEWEQGWLTVWFNQPERRNPLTDAVVADLQRICEAIEHDRSVRGLTPVSYTHLTLPTTPYV